jgi:tetratricopeptide (TPR) repeat protein
MMGRYSEARELLDRVSLDDGSIRPSEARRVFERIGLLAQQLDEPELIISAYSRALAYPPESGVYWMWIGLAQRELGDITAAFSSLSRSTELLKPEQIQAFTWSKAQLGLTRHALGDCPGALGELREALALCEETPACPGERLDWLHTQIEWVRRCELDNP